MQRLKDERDARLEEVIDRLEKEVRRAEEGEAARSAEKHRSERSPSTPGRDFPPRNCRGRT